MKRKLIQGVSAFKESDWYDAVAKLANVGVLSVDVPVNTIANRSPQLM